MSLVALLNDAQPPEPEGVVFTDVQACDPAARAYLIQHPDLRMSARASCDALRAEFADADISVRLDIDPDDAQRSIVFHLRVPGLTRDRRIVFYDLAGRLAEDHKDRFVFVVDRA